MKKPSALLRQLQHATLCVLALAIASLGSPAVAEAGIISTLEAVESQNRSESLGAVNAVLARDEVRAELAALGVGMEAVEARLAALTDTELQSMARQLGELPAGAGALEVLGIVFLVLLVLEAVGVLDIFSKFP